MNPTNPTNRTNSMNSTNSANPKIAVLGAGNWGRNLVRVFCELVGSGNIIVCDPDRSRREAMIAAHPGIATAEGPSYDGVDAVVIAAPAVMHYELAKEALLAGMDVLVEKPIALSSSEAEELIDIAERNRRILMVDHLLEYHPAVVKLKELADEGRFGRLLHLTSQRLNLGVIRSEENALWSLAPHDISVILHLLEEEPDEVIARGEVYLQDGIEDMAYVTLRFSSGTLGLIHTSWLDPVKTRRLTVVGDEGMAVFDDLAPDKLVIYDHAIEKVNGRYRTERGEGRPVAIEGTEPLSAMAEAFLRSLRTRQDPPSGGRDGLRVVRVLEAAQASMRGH